MLKVNLTDTSGYPHDLFQRVNCPNCAEWIRMEANACPYCSASNQAWQQQMTDAVMARKAAVRRTRRNAFFFTLFLIASGLLLFLYLTKRA